MTRRKGATKSALTLPIRTCGISGVTTAGVAVPVLIDTSGQLGTISSSRRFKKDIHDMGGASRGLLRLRPVTFRYKAKSSESVQYGLIAEEVAEVYPELVQYSPSGEAQTVLYHLLDAMLLNEVQRQEKEISALKERLARLEDIVAHIASRGTGEPK